jgi:glycine/D-amino acid oxidase-like deaminating enzyme
VAADVFVSCCGRWTPEVAARAGVSIPLVPAETGSEAVGLLAAAAPGATRLRRVVSSPQLNLRPDGDGRILLQALDLDGTVRPEAPRGIDSPHGAELLRRAGRLLRDFRGAHLESLRVGVRALPVDGRSVVGWAPGVEGLYVVVTHSGITLAPVLGELAAREVGGGADEALLRPFRPSRFASDVLHGSGSG